MESDSKIPILVATILGVLALMIFGCVRYVTFKSNLLLSNYLSEQYDFISANQEKFAESLKISRGLPLQAGKSSDAGKELATRMRWHPPRPPKADPESLEGVRVPVRFDILAAKLAGWQDNWVTHAREISTSEFDVAWLSRLDKFDYWAFEASPELKPGTGKTQELIQPGFQDFVIWSRIRLARGIVGSDLATAQEQVSHLAILLWSAERRPAAEAALRILKDCRLTGPRSAGGALAPGMFSFEEIAALETGVRLMPGFLDPVTPFQNLQVIFESPGSIPFLCIALQQTVDRLLTSRILLYGVFNQNISALDPIVRAGQAQCRNRALAAWLNADYVPAHVGQDFAPTSVPYFGMGLIYSVLKNYTGIAGYYKGRLASPLAYFPLVRLAYGIDLLRADRRTPNVAAPGG